MKLWIGLDTATTSGIALYKPHLAQVHLVKGNPIDDLAFINRLLQEPNVKAHECIFVFEKIHNFMNAHTTRLILEKYGFVKWNLIACGFRVEEVSPKVARKFLGTKEKKDVFDLMRGKFQGSIFTSDHADALAVAMYQAHLEGELNDLVIPEIRGGNVE